jgi:chromosome segregation ATPase
LTVALDRLHAEEDADRAALQNGAGRRQREKLRAQLKSLERRGIRLRGSLADAEERLEVLAGRMNGKVPSVADLVARQAGASR